MYTSNVQIDSVLVSISSKIFFNFCLILKVRCFFQHFFVFLLFCETFIRHYFFPFFVWIWLLNFDFRNIIFVLYLLSFRQINAFILNFFQSFLGLFSQLLFTLLLLHELLCLFRVFLFDILMQFWYYFSPPNLNNWNRGLSLLEFFVSLVLPFFFTTNYLR